MSSFRIRSNIVSANAQRNLTDVNGSFSKSMDRLASGKRITSAADDAAGLSIANKMRSDIRSLGVAGRNITEANSVLQIAEGSANGLVGILERLKELAMQSASSNAGTQRGTLDAEFQAQKDEIDRVVDATNYMGINLLDGSFDGVFQIGPENDPSSQLEVDLSGVILSTAGLDIDTLDILDQVDAQNALTDIDAALDDVNAALGDIGAYMNRLSSAHESVITAEINLQASESVIRDVDISAEITEFSKYQVLQQVGASMLASANAAPQSVLTLLQ